MLILVGMFSALKCWLFPELPSYFTSLIPGASPYAHYTRPLISLTFSYFAISATVLFAFITAHMMSSMPVFVVLMQAEFRPGLDPSLYFTRSSFRQVSNLPMFYRQVEILLKLLTDVYAFMLLPTEWLLTVTVICCNCCLILYRHYLNRIQLTSLTNVLIVSGSIILGLFEFGGRFDKYSRNTIATWKRYRWRWQRIRSGKWEREYVFKFARSCRPLSFCYKELRKIQRTTLLRVLKSIAVYTFKAVKTFRKGK